MTVDGQVLVKNYVVTYCKQKIKKRSVCAYNAFRS